MTLHLDAISDEQKTVLRNLGPVAAEYGFYLAGGTAVALQLGHRRSVDLGWFTDKRLSDPMHWAQQLRDAGVGFKTESVDNGTLHGSINSAKRTSLRLTTWRV